MPLCTVQHLPHLTAPASAGHQIPPHSRLSITCIFTSRVPSSASLSLLPLARTTTTHNSLISRRRHPRAPRLRPIRGTTRPRRDPSTSHGAGGARVARRLGNAVVVGGMVSYRVRLALCLEVAERCGALAAAWAGWMRGERRAGVGAAAAHCLDVLDLRVLVAWAEVYLCRVKGTRPLGADGIGGVGSSGGGSSSSSSSSWLD